MQNYEHLDELDKNIYDLQKTIIERLSVKSKLGANYLNSTSILQIQYRARGVVLSLLHSEFSDSQLADPPILGPGNEVGTGPYDSKTVQVSSYASVLSALFLF